MLNIDSKIKNEIQNYRLSVPKYTDRSVLEEPDYKENVQTQLYTENRHSNMHQTVKRDDSVRQIPHEKQRSDRSFIREEENFEIQKTKKDCRLFIKANEQYQPEFHKQVPQSTKNRISSDEKMRWED